MRNGKADWWDGLSPRWTAAIAILGTAFCVWGFWDLLVMMWDRFGYWSPIAVLVIAGLAAIPFSPIILAIVVVLTIGLLFGPVGIGAAILVCLYLLPRK